MKEVERNVNLNHKWSKFFFNLPPSIRLTPWEGRQLILAELFEFFEALSEYESLKTPESYTSVLNESFDVIGNINYLGIHLFKLSLALMKEKNYSTFFKFVCCWDFWRNHRSELITKSNKQIRNSSYAELHQDEIQTLIIYFIRNPK